MNFQSRAAALSDTIIADRRHIHSHPELSFKEHETTAYITSTLEGLGIPVQCFDDYPGCIATIRGGKPGERTVLLRADIDALPITEASGVPFESANPGVMHACGHDCHSSMLLGAARLLREVQDEIPGTVKLLFQSGEECFVGSHYYVDHGFLDGIDAAMGMHVWPIIPSGKLAIIDGPALASCDNFVITVHGVAAHGSTPNLSKDAIVAASAIVLALQTIVSRANNPLHSLALSVGSVHGGARCNIIADTVVLEGTVRTHSPEARRMVKPMLFQIVEHTAKAMGCTADIQYDELVAPVINRDTALNDLARKSAVRLYGADVLCDPGKIMGSEDFSYIMEKIPSSLFVFLGYQDESCGCHWPLHSNHFRIREDILQIGAAEYAQFAFDYLADKQN